MTKTYTITVEPLERAVLRRADQNILHIRLRQGVWLPHALTTTRRRRVRWQVLENGVEHNDASSFALMDYERNEGKTQIFHTAQTSRSPFRGKA